MTDIHPRNIDTEYLLNDQYKTANNLQARANLHIKFSANKYGWHRWVFDQFDLPAAARIIEFGTGQAGCGPKTWIASLATGISQLQTFRLGCSKKVSAISHPVHTPSSTR